MVDIEELYVERCALKDLVASIYKKKQSIDTEYRLLTDKVSKVNELIVAIQNHCHHDWKDDGFTSHGRERWRKCIICKKLDQY